MKKVYLILAGFLLFHLFLLFNLRFTAWPEMVSYPYLLNNGFKLYTDFVHPYPPVLTLFLAGLYKIFGYKLIVLKTFTWLLILSNDVLIFLIVKKLTKYNLGAILTLASYVLLQSFLEGNQLWFDLAIVPSLLFGTLLLIKKKYFWAGLGFALAALIKQTVGIYLVITFLYLIFTKEKLKNVYSFAVGPIALGALLVLYLISANSFSDFLNWTLVYPFTYWTKFPGYVQMSLNKTQILILASLLLPLILIASKAKKYTLMFLFFAASLVLVYPRFSFFHFQLALAFLAILYGIILAETKQVTYRFLLIIPLVVVFFKAPYVFGGEARFWDRQDLKFSEVIRSNVGPH